MIGKLYLKIGGIVILLITLLFSCKEKKKQRFEGFDKGKEDFYYKRITIGEGTLTPKEGDSVYVQMVFADSLNNAFFNSSGSVLYGVLGFKVGAPGSHIIENALLTMVEGDSTIFKIVADTLYREAFNIDLPQQIKKGELLNVNAKIVLHKTAEKIAFEAKQFAVWCNEMSIVENDKIKNYLKANRITSLPDSNGIYWLSNQKGTGKPVYLLPMAYVYYIGSNLEGKVFDNSYATQTPLEYIPGKSGQLLKGLELLVGSMKIGAKAKIILPSQLAFGSSGSSNGLIPPFETVIYEIEITDTKKQNPL